MTRQHSAGYTPAHDPYAWARCDCGHIFYADDSAGKPCRWDLCGCTNHQPSEVPDATSS